MGPGPQGSTVKRQTGKCAELWYKCGGRGRGGPEALLRSGVSGGT